jgi:hypothetical protein
MIKSMNSNKTEIIKSVASFVMAAVLFGGCYKKWDEGGGLSLLYSKRSVVFDPASGDVQESIEHDRKSRIGYNVDKRSKTITFYRNEKENYAHYYNTVDSSKDVMICDSLYSCNCYMSDDNVELCFATKYNFGLFFFFIEDGKITDDFNCLEYVFF